MTQEHKDSAYRSALMFMVWLITQHKAFNKEWVFTPIYLWYLFSKKVSYLLWYRNTGGMCRNCKKVLSVRLLNNTPDQVIFHHLRGKPKLANRLLGFKVFDVN